MTVNLSFNTVKFEVNTGLIELRSEVLNKRVGGRVEFQCVASGAQREDDI
jgi:hypothetical protein